MARFNPNMLQPAQAQSNTSNARSATEVALANIDKMREQYAAGDGAEGKLNFRKAEDGRIAFTIRVSNTALVLERTKVEDTEVEVKEMTVPEANFTDALNYYADRIRGGEYTAQLEALTARKAARAEKLKATRAQKKEQGAKPAS